MAEPRYCFSTKKLLIDDFDPSEFVNECPVGGRRLTSDLETYLQVVKDKLADLVFLECGKLLKITHQFDGMDSALNKLRKPLDAVRDYANEIRSDLEEKINVIKGLLEEERETARQLLWIESFERKVVLLCAFNHACRCSNSCSCLLRRQNAAADPFALDSCARRLIHLESKCANLSNTMHVVGNQQEWKCALESVTARLLACREQLGGALSTRAREAFATLKTELAGGAVSMELSGSIACLSTAFRRLGIGAVAERLFAECLVSPLLKKYITEITIHGKQRKGFDGFVESIRNLFPSFRALAKCASTQFSLDQCGVDFVANAVFQPLMNHLLDVGAEMFDSDVPSVFRRCFVETVRFVQAVCAVDGSPSITSRVRSVSAVQTCLQKWGAGAPIVFQLTVKKLVSSMEGALTTPVSDPPLPSDVGKFGLALVGSRSVWAAIISSSSPCFLTPNTFPRVAKLGLQAVSRFVMWLSPLRALLTVETGGGEGEGGPSPWPESPSALLLLVIARDCSILQRLLTKHYLETLPGHVKSTPLLFGSIEEDLQSAMESVLSASVGLLSEVIASLIREVVRIVVSDCAEFSVAVRSVPSQYRMTKRPVPTSASLYVGHMMQPLIRFTKAAEEMPAGDLPSPQHLAAMVLQELIMKFSSALRAVTATVRRTDASLKRLSTSSNSLPRSAANARLSDFEKIFEQLRLDVEAFFGTAAQLSGGTADDMLEEKRAAMRKIVEYNDES